MYSYLVKVPPSKVIILVVITLILILVTAGARVKKQNGTIHGHEVSTKTAIPNTYNNVVRNRQESTNL